MNLITIKNMKKVLLLLTLILLGFSGFAQFEAGEYLNSDTLKNKGVDVYVEHLKLKPEDIGKVPIHQGNTVQWTDFMRDSVNYLDLSFGCSGDTVVNSGETFILFDAPYNASFEKIEVIAYVRRVSDNAVIDYVVSDVSNFGFKISVWEDSIFVGYVAFPRTVGESNIDSLLGSHLTEYAQLTDFDTLSHNFLKNKNSNPNYLHVTSTDIASINKFVRDSSNYVTYTGNDRDLDMGAYKFTAQTAKITGLAGVGTRLGTVASDGTVGASVITQNTSNDIEINQNGVQPFTSIASGAVDNTLYLTGGKVGIRQNAPQTLLHISGTGATLSIQGANTPGGVQGIQFLYANTLYSGYIGSVTKQWGGGSLVFAPASSALVQTEAMRIRYDGKIGIKTTSPDAQVDINSENGDCLQLTYNDNDGSAVNKVNYTVDATGDGNINSSGDTLNIDDHINVKSIKSTNLAGTGTRLVAATSNGTLTPSIAKQSGDTLTVVNTIKKGLESSTVPGVTFTQTANQTIANTTTETTMFGTGVGSLVLPANFFTAGKTVRVKIKGFLSATNGDIATLKIKLNDSIMVNSAGTFVTLTDVGADIEFDLTCRTTGTTGTVIGQGFSTVSGGQGFSMSTVRSLQMLTTKTINTTVAQTINFTYQWNSAKTGNTITTTNASVEVLN